ncbi:hypothetical protein Tco_1123199 [Tanacetum coccineum]|uniref:Uncharacterized protein n=1 Tax=Tanacetum coccineum TaxID=301880 RepID=A0ABQ5J2Y2_9ASTR
MAPMAFVPKHNQVGFLKKPEGSAGFEQIVDFLKGTHIRGFAGVYRPLLANMIAGHDENQGEPQEEPVESQPPPNASVPSTSQPTTKRHPDQELDTGTELHGSSSDFATRINVADLLHLVPQLVTRIDNLEKELKENKQTTTAVIVKLGRKLGEEDVFETPKGKDLGEADLSPNGLQAAETLVQKLDVKVSSSDRESAFEKFKSASEEIKPGFTNITSGEVRVSQRKGKEVLEEQPQPKRSKKHIREEEASLAEIARIQAQEAAELQRLDELADKRLNDELEMTEQQTKRATEVQQQAQNYTKEYWHLIRARMEASTKLRKSVFGTDIKVEDYAKKMVELVEKRRREIREQKLKAKEE